MDIINFFIVYIVGTLIGFYLSCRFFRRDYENNIIEMLVDNGFLRHKLDQDGNVIILKWHDNR